MSLIINVAASIEDVANQVINMNRAFHRRYEHHKNVCFDVNLRWWDKSRVLNQYSETLEVTKDTELPALYRDVRRIGQMDAVSKAPRDFAVTITSQGSPKYGNYLLDEWYTTIYNMTMLQDILDGINVPPQVKSFLINTVPKYHEQKYDPHVGDYISASKYLNEFIDQRNRVMTEFEKRINASVSKAAYNMMNDLHK